VVEVEADVADGVPGGLRA